jgi:PKD repeat protein
MISNVHIVRKALIYMSLWIALTVELTIFGAATFAQNYAPGLLPPPSAGSAGNATVPSDSATPIPPSLPSEAADSTQMGTAAVPSDPGTTMQPSLPSTAGAATQLGITATLLAVPVYGRGPLTVDFYVGLANPHGSLVYEWNFGDGAISVMQASVYMLHVYQQPGSYLCTLSLTSAQGLTTTVFTTITVQPSQS